MVKILYNKNNNNLQISKKNEKTVFMNDGYL